MTIQTHLRPAYFTTSDADEAFVRQGFIPEFFMSTASFTRAFNWVSKAVLIISRLRRALHSSFVSPSVACEPCLGSGMFGCPLCRVRNVWLPSGRGPRCFWRGPLDDNSYPQSFLFFYPESFINFDYFMNAYFELRVAAWPCGKCSRHVVSVVPGSNLTQR